MRVHVIIHLLCVVATLCFESVSGSAKYENPKNVKEATSIYDFWATDIQGNEVSLEKYRGHVCIIVNVASECGLTDTNYDQLNDLYQNYSVSKSLKILGFPSNEFLSQEPGSDEEILAFAMYRGVKFDLFSKIEVNGENAHPLWKYLKYRQGGSFGNSIKWNFTKFIIDKTGQVVERFAPTTDPLDMVKYLEKYFQEEENGRPSVNKKKEL